MIIFLLFLVSIGAVLLFFAGYQFLFMLLSILSRVFESAAGNTAASGETRFAVLIPAHNEELLIGDLLESIHNCDYPQQYLQVYVIADNCGSEDRTAEIARSLGADVRERFDDTKRGKPWALNWLISSIDLDAHDAYVIIDADTVVDGLFFKNMEHRLHQGDEAIQGYFGVMNPGESWLTRLSILPGILKFHLHFPGKKMLGFSCPLAGNGMCFSRKIFKQFGWNAFSIAENWEYYVQLFLQGYRVGSAEDAIIYSQVAKNLQIGKDQRQRWQLGRIDTLSRYWKPLLSRAIYRLDLAAMDCLVEVLRPSHSILLFWSGVYFACSAAVYAYRPEFSTVFYISILCLLLQLCYFLAGLLIQRAPLSTWLSLFMVPPYLVWKVLISMQILKKGKHGKWIKTERHR